MESDNTINDYKNGNSEFKNNILAVYSTPYKSGNQTLLSNADLKAKAEAEGTVTLATREAVQLTDPFTLGAPNFLPKAGSPALSGTDYTGMDAFFTPSTYRGAFGTTNWMQGWTSFTPKNNTY